MTRRLRSTCRSCRESEEGGRTWEGRGGSVSASRLVLHNLVTLQQLRSRGRSRTSVNAQVTVNVEALVHLNLKFPQLWRRSGAIFEGRRVEVRPGRSARRKRKEGGGRGRKGISKGRKSRFLQPAQLKSE